MTDTPSRPTFFVPGATAAHLQHAHSDGPLPAVAGLAFDTPDGTVAGARGRDFDRGLDLDDLAAVVDAAETELAQQYGVTRRPESSSAASWDLTETA
jgi:hypothetical protein